MKSFRKRVGDIYLNPLMSDLWILNKIWNKEEGKEVWTLNLVNDDCQEELKYVVGFIKVGNIYDLVNEKLKEKNEKGKNIL